MSKIPYLAEWSHGRKSFTSAYNRVSILSVRGSAAVEVWQGMTFERIVTFGRVTHLIPTVPPASLSTQLIQLSLHFVLFYYRISEGGWALDSTLVLSTHLNSTRCNKCKQTTPSGTTTGITLNRSSFGG